MSSEDFIRALEAGGISGETARFVLGQVQPYYVSSLTPQPGDRLDSTMRIDPEDLEDIAAAYFKQFGLPKPSCADPAILPADPSHLELAIWLDQQRAAHLAAPSTL